MRNSWILFVSLLTWAAGATAGQVEVAFPNSDHYTDAALDEREPLLALRGIEAHLKKLGARYLPAKESLAVSFLDIDLAGRESYTTQSANRPRILTSVTWPRMKLHYRLSEGDRVLAEGDETLTDLTYLDHVNRYGRTDLLRYDKRMLDDWFRQRFEAAPK
jgi:hypothetical protein